MCLMKTNIGHYQTVTHDRVKYTHGRVFNANTHKTLSDCHIRSCQIHARSCAPAITKLIKQPLSLDNDVITWTYLWIFHTYVAFPSYVAHIWNLKNFKNFTYIHFDVPNAYINWIRHNHLDSQRQENKVGYTSRRKKTYSMTVTHTRPCQKST
jgi:hypothetical protein